MVDIETYEDSEEDRSSRAEGGKVETYGSEKKQPAYKKPSFFERVKENFKERSEIKKIEKEAYKKELARAKNEEAGRAMQERLDAQRDRARSHASRGRRFKQGVRSVARKAGTSFMNFGRSQNRSYSMGNPPRRSARRSNSMGLGFRFPLLDNKPIRRSGGLGSGSFFNNPMMRDLAPRGRSRRSGGLGGLSMLDEIYGKPRRLRHKKDRSSRKHKRGRSIIIRL